MAKTKKEVTNEDVLRAVGGLTVAVTQLVELQKPKVPIAPAEVEPTPARTSFPIPLEYRELVNTLLNKHFEIDINYTGADSFEFSILVPKKYSNASEAHWQTHKEDRRTKVIQAAYGANGVREWVTKVYENFPDTTKSAITYDRAQP